MSYTPLDDEQRNAMVACGWSLVENRTGSDDLSERMLNYTRLYHVDEFREISKLSFFLAQTDIFKGKSQKKTT